MWREQVQRRTLGHDAGRVDGLVTGVVVVLDVGEVHGGCHARPLVQLTQPAMQARIVEDALLVALEVTVVDRVEADQGGEQAPVCLGQVLAGQVALPAQALFKPVQLAEQVVVGFFVGVLGGREAGPVHAVVHPWVDARVERVDLAMQGLGIQVEGRAGQAIEGAVEHAQDVRRFVADDALLTLVPEHRYRHPAGVVRIVLPVALVEKLQIIQGIAARAGLGVEGPAVLAHQPAHHRNLNDVL